MNRNASTTGSGSARAAGRLFAAIKGLVAHHPWLQGRVTGLLELACRDAGMASKALRFSPTTMGRRSVAVDDVSALRFAVGTCSTAIPAYLRREMSAGRGRKATGPDPK